MVRTLIEPQLRELGARIEQFSLTFAARWARTQIADVTGSAVVKIILAARQYLDDAILAQAGDELGKSCDPLGLELPTGPDEVAAAAGAGNKCVGSDSAG
jgi:hypothetical protein